MTTDKKRLRVLHIGNVANYAYNIGKIIQTEEIESHVISWDYYHINAQPIWEEGVFDASAVGDQYFPILPNASEAGFTTPDWYTQGPRILACLALIARNEGKHDRAALIHKTLVKHLQKLPSPVYRKQMASGRQRILELVYTDMLIGNGSTTSTAWRVAKRLIASSPLISPLLSAFLGTKWKVRGSASAAKWALLGRVYPMKLAVMHGASATKWALLGGVYRVKLAANAKKWKALNQIDALKYAAKRQGAKLPTSIKIRIKSALGTREPLSQLAYPKNSVEPVNIADSIHEDLAAINPPDAHKDVIEVQSETPFERHVQTLIAQYKAIYPERDFDPMLLRQYEHTLPLMRRLFSHYDLVIGYAIEGIWPLMAGVPYVAYEFGTIRNLPFQDTPTGHLAALTYLNCEQIIVTNSDNEAPAKRLGRPYFFLPHVVNESGLLNEDQANAARTEFIDQHGGDFIVFHPPRQHWDEKRDTSWDKGNDHLFRGFAQLVKQHAPNSRCIAVAWGETLKRSKDLIEELGISENVVWILPQPHIAMMRYIGVCDVLCDQFTIPTFGGIPPKAFHAGKPVVTSFDPALHKWCFAEMPPLLPANSAAGVYAALTRLYTDKAYATKLGRRGADWYKRENSNARVREVLMQKLEGLNLPA